MKKTLAVMAAMLAFGMCMAGCAQSGKEPDDLFKRLCLLLVGELGIVTGKVCNDDLSLCVGKIAVDLLGDEGGVGAQLYQ